MTGRLAKRALLSSLALAAAASSAQLPSPSAGDTAFREEVSVGYVLVPIVANSRAGLADRLAEKEFRLSVDGTPVPIESFESGASVPIGILFLQDLSGSMGIGSKLRLSRDLVECMLDLERGGDEFAVASFSNRKLFVEVPFPGSRETVLEIAGGWKGYGRTALHDAVAWLPDLVHSRSSPRRAVVLVTDGVDNASALAAAAAREEIKQAEVPVHVIGLETGDIYAIDSAGDKVHPLADMLHLIGWATGGSYRSVETASDVRRACHEIVEELRHQYVLGFSTRADGVPGRHEIEVEVPGRAKKLRLRYRRSYEGNQPIQ